MTHMTEAHADAMPDILLYPRDTVMRALEVMHRYGVELLPVVEERRGEVLGHVTLAELQRLGNALPLVRMTEVLTARAAIASERNAVAHSEHAAAAAEEQGAALAWLH